MITLFVGDNDIGLAEQAQEYDARAFLVDSSNWKTIAKDSLDHAITVYTSLADLPKIDRNTHALWEIIQRATKIFYCPPPRWSDDSENFSWSSQQCLVEFYLHQAQISGCPVIGLDLTRYRESSYLKLTQNRTGSDQCLWVSGCSISHGIGVSVEERFGTIIGRKLDLPTYHLTRGGSSLEWAADQILRSDIRPGDMVIWGLTEERRGPLAHNGKVTVLDDSRDFIDQRLSETRYYKAITSVNQVINVTRKIGCRLIILPLICSEKLCMDLIHHDELHCLPYQTRYVDLGTDDLHPGPQQHAIYANFCLEIIRHARES